MERYNGGAWSKNSIATETTGQTPEHDAVEEIASLDQQALLQILKTRNISLPNDLSTVFEQKWWKLKTRTLGIWHDHSSILGRGYILITVSVTNPEHMQTKDIQAYIEEPEISIIAMSSSSIQDQAALIADRMECIQDMSTPLSGVPITDKLKFFYGDKPEAQFERGTQIGGHYPCGACGTHVSRFDGPRFKFFPPNIHVGPSGRKSGYSKPFENLTSAKKNSKHTKAELEKLN